MGDGTRFVGAWAVKFGNLIAVQVVVGTLNPVEDPLLYVSYRQLRHFRNGKNEKRLSAVRQLIRLPDK